MNTVAKAASHFFAWWLRELGACVPASLRMLAKRRKPIVVINLNGDVAEVVLHGTDEVRELGHIPLAPAPASQAALSAVLRGLAPRRHDVVLAVPAESVLRRDVVLPLEASENLREVLAFEMDRHTPFKASDVAYDYRLVATDPASRKLTVDLAVLPRAVLAQAASIADRLGLRGSRIGVAGDEPNAARSFDFRRYEDLGADSAGRRPAARSALYACAAATAAMAILAWYLPLHLQNRALAAYELRLDEMRTAAHRADELKKQLATEAELTRFVTEQRDATPPVISILAEITDRLPDDTWLTQLKLQGGKLTLTGLSSSVPPLIAKLEASRLISDVRFGSPMTPDAVSGRERFSILAHIVQDRSS
jgi:general secretion pathway protein L